MERHAALQIQIRESTSHQHCMIAEDVIQKCLKLIDKDVIQKRLKLIAKDVILKCLKILKYMTISQQIEELEPEPDSAGETVVPDDPCIKVIFPIDMETLSTINTRGHIKSSRGSNVTL